MKDGLGFRLAIVCQLLAIIFAFSGCSVTAPLSDKEAASGWNTPELWRMSNNPESTGSFEACRDGLRLAYALGGEHGWVQLGIKPTNAVPNTAPVVLQIKADGTGDLELKLIDVDGSVFGRKTPMSQYGKRTQLVLYPAHSDYWWGGDDNFDELAEFQLAVSGKGRGVLLVSDIGPGEAGLAASFPPAGPMLDPDRNLAGIGFRQRRDAKLIPEDPLVLEWLKQIQDTATPDRALVSSMECSELHTFNNALVAMAFMLKGERERAERILDFFAGATDRSNTDPTLQNFFYRGEARGFFQAVTRQPETGEYHADKRDRWMGDMAWLLFAYKHYEQNYGDRRYEGIVRLLSDLLLSWYTDAADGPGGYVQHGWRKGDSKLHEDHGHHEGNLDCHAVFKLIGERERAKDIGTWLDRTMKGRNLPLDLYTWRVLSYDGEQAEALDIPDHDLRFRKTLMVDGRAVAGVYDSPDANVTNIWFDGVGHMACAYFAAGNMERGNFYANQFDPFIVDRVIGGAPCRAVPFAANRTGNYSWVDPQRGFASAAAWYIFAKNRFNPFTLKQHVD